MQGTLVSLTVSAFKFGDSFLGVNRYLVTPTVANLNGLLHHVSHSVQWADMLATEYMPIGRSENCVKYDYVMLINRFRRLKMYRRMDTL